MQVQFENVHFKGLFWGLEQALHLAALGVNDKRLGRDRRGKLAVFTEVGVL